MASVETTKIDDKKRLHFLEWFSNAKFECSNESRDRYFCNDPQLDEMVTNLLEGIYAPVNDSNSHER